MHSVIVAVVSVIVGIAVGYGFRGREAKIITEIYLELEKLVAELKAAAAEVKSKL